MPRLARFRHQSLAHGLVAYLLRTYSYDESPPPVARLSDKVGWEVVSDDGCDYSADVAAFEAGVIAAAELVVSDTLRAAHSPVIGGVGVYKLGDRTYADDRRFADASEVVRHLLAPPGKGQ